ncbi:hypothetical protein [Mucilaginibacter ginsenosidivorans]|uniref:Uncharacterized protein n=1 Tax=Mucilaginibacter ginsenosidivorans TaxID=398053 RepID=A0A5B8UW30_9SPHI|nr:hypothetical protein [Mucilaginibacter ginsenosidivorans]QEC63330.1 hypothetical protein FRZ54_12345 [Mucilaginibacter ginsenosidivorans]
MTTIEHKELRGITLKNLIVTIVSTASIVASVMTTYFQLRNDLHDIRQKQEADARVNDLRLKVLESEVSILQQQVDEIKNERTVAFRQKN